jgi:CheY-like chemotaxis protein
VFDPFFTTKPPGEGTGLGLFLSYGIADAHGGTLSVDTTPGSGCAFTLALPRGDVAPLPAIPPAAEPVPARRILVVDDDEGMRRLAAVFFAHEGHVVDDARDGDEGLARAIAGDYDLVIADRRAAVGGEPFAAALTRARPDWAARLVVSGGAPGETAGARTLLKPFTPRDLRAVAADVWGAPA